jgi:hypothetical protein
MRRPVGGAAGIGRVGVSCALGAAACMGRVGVSGGAVPAAHIRVLVPARGEGIEVLGGGWGWGVSLGGGVFEAMGAVCRIRGGLAPVPGGVIERPTDDGAGPGPGLPIRVTSEELGSVTDCETWPPLGGPSGSSSERSLFSPSATLSSSTTVGPL